MENPLKLRKPSIKNLVDLLIVSEEILFSFPIPSDLRSKYERMRIETFTKLRIKSPPIPPSSPPEDHLSKVLVLEMFNILQQSILTLEAYEEELSFKSISLKNIFNEISSTNKYPLKSVKARKSEDFEKWNDLKYEDLLEKYQKKLHEKISSLTRTKPELEEIENEVLDIIKKNQSNILVKSDKKIEELQTENKRLNEQLKKTLNDLEKNKNEKESDRKVFETELSSLKAEIKGLKKEEKKDSKEENLIEVISLRQKLAEVELFNSKLQSKLAYLQEAYDQSLASNKALKEKSENLEAKSKQLKNERIETENLLEYERNSFESKLKSIQQDYFNKEITMKDLQNENLQRLHEVHKQELRETCANYEVEIEKLKEDSSYFKKQIQANEENNKRVIKSLQMEVLKAKEVIVQQYQELSHESELKKSQEIVEKLENSLINSQNCFKYLSELLVPFYDAYARQQKDWNESEIMRNLFGFEQEYLGLVVSAEFLVFFLEKCLKDKTWLLNKLEEMHSEAKATKTNTVGILTSPSSFREKGLYRQIWEDIKDTSVVLEKFERCRENLIAHFTKS